MGVVLTKPRRIHTINLAGTCHCYVRIHHLSMSAYIKSPDVRPHQLKATPLSSLSAHVFSKQYRSYLLPNPHTRPQQGCLAIARGLALANKNFAQKVIVCFLSFVRAIHSFSEACPLASAIVFVRSKRNMKFFQLFSC